MIEALLASVSTASLIAVLGYMGRTWLKARLTASIRLETESKLAKVKADIEKANKRISEVYSAGTAANSHAESVLINHKIEAVKAAWASVLDWQKVTAVTDMMAVFSQDWIKENSNHPGTKSSVEQLLGGIDHLDFLKQQNAIESVRPFLSEKGWALFFAYNSFHTSRLTKASLLLIQGIDHSDLWGQIDERALVKKSAPSDILQAYDKNIFDGTARYLNHLRESMLLEFREHLSGKRASSEAAENAAGIVAAAESLVSSAEKKAQGAAKSA